jgi:hypothetical protein
MTPDHKRMISFVNLTLSRSQFVRQAYRVMMFVFTLFVLVPLFPVQLYSQEWGI